MSERKIEALNFNGEIIYVEVAEVEQEGPDIVRPSDGYEETSTESELISAGERVRSTISALAATIQAALDKAA